MNTHRLSACLLGFAFASISSSAFADPPDVPPPPSESPSAPPPDTPATSGPAATPAAAAATAPPDAVADRPALASPGRKIDLSTPPPAESNPRSYHMHDGFYLRTSVGFGSLRATFADDRVSSDSLHGAGGSLHLNLLIGGSPNPGLAIGGALLAEGTASVDFDYEDGEHAYDRSMSLVIVGPFVDGFPRPNRGWHLGGALGLAQLTLGKMSRDERRTTNGIGGSFWLGNDFWVAPDWSVGPLLKFTGAVTGSGDPDITAQSFSISILFTALYH